MMEQRYLLSTCIMYDEREAEHVQECIHTIPEWSEIVLMQLRRPTTTQFEGTIIPYQGDNNRVREYLYYVSEENFHFGRLRNTLKRYATGVWIFSLDADERLPVHRSTYMRKILEQAPAQVGGLYVSVHSWKRSADAFGIGERHSAPCLRLFRNLPEFQWAGYVHEQILPSIQKHGYRAVDTSYLIDHTGYENPASLHDKVSRNLRLLVKELAENFVQPYYIDSLLQTCSLYSQLKELS